MPTDSAPPLDPSPPARRPRPSDRGWHSLIGASALLALAILVMVALRAESSTDFRDFWENALHFRQTGQISAELGVHNYLPFFTIFMVPWSFLPLRVAAVLFVLLSLALFALTVYLVDGLLNEQVRSGPRRALLVTLLLALPYVYSCAVVGNLGLLLLFLIVAAWFLVERGHEWEAGAALGLATLIKLLPGVLVLYFLLRRRWRVAGGAAAIAVVLGLGLPLAALGPRETLAEHVAFYHRAVEGHAPARTILADKPHKFDYSNNALPMVLRRLLSPLPAGERSDGQLFRVNIADWPRSRILWLYAAIAVAIVAASVVVTLRGPQRWPPEDVIEVRRVRAQFALWCGVMLLAAPLVWTHYLPLMYWPLAVIADAADRAAHRAASSAGRGTGPARLCLLALLVWLICAGLLVWPAARAAGAQLAGIAALWLACLGLTLRPR